MRFKVTITLNPIVIDADDVNAAVAEAQRLVAEDVGAHSDSTCVKVLPGAPFGG